MGLEEKVENKVQPEEEREFIINILTNVLNTNIEIMRFYKKIATDDKSIEICDKSIKQSEDGLKQIKKIVHLEILRSLFSKIVYGKEPYFAMCGSLCSFEKIKKWDTTKKGFKEFMDLEKAAIEEAKTKQQEIIKQQELVKKAKEEGKKVEMIFDKDTKKIKPVIIEEKENA